MYPNLYYAFKDIFGISVPALSFVNSFGFFLAIAFIVGAWLLAKELKRKSSNGLLQPTEVNVQVGRPATPLELITNFFLGFIFGYKILAMFFLGEEATRDPQAFIFSSNGNWPLGIGLGLLFAAFKWWDKRKEALPKPETRKIRMWPQDRVGEITILALIFGVLGAKLFDIFENWTDFLRRPMAYILSGGGLTFYGGLICATAAIVWYAKKHKISIRHLADSIAPPLMIAYAIGRIGCQVSGDGDWGIYNSAFKTEPDGEISAAAPGDFNAALSANTAFFSDYADSSQVEHAYFAKPAALNFLPDWFFAYNFPNNVNKVGVPITSCTEQHCKQLPIPVFPTSLYETIACSILFFILWSLRKRIRVYGGLFVLYLVLNGLERFLIEKIRVNNQFDFFGLHPTQAEVISVALILSGIILWIILSRKYDSKPA